MNLFRLFSLAALALLPFAQAGAYETELKSLSQNLADKIAASGKTQVAVVGFLDSSRKMTQLGQFLADEIAVNLADSGKGFKVISRSRLDALIKEQKIVYSGLVDDPKVASQLGKVAGVEALITATLTPMSDAVRLQAQIINAETAAIEGGVNGNIQLTKQIEELLKKSVSVSDSITGEASTSEENKANLKPIASVDESSFIASLMSCNAKDTIITCTINVRCKRNDDCNGLELGKSRVSDQDGEWYDATLEFKNGATKRDIPLDVTVPTFLSFTGVPVNITYLSLLEVNIWGTRKFRNIPITR